MTLCFEVFSANTDATDLAYTWGLEDGAEGVQAVCPLLGEGPQAAYREGFADGRLLAKRFERRQRVRAVAYA